LLLFSRELKKFGFNVVATTSPAQAMAAIVGGSIGCLITDQAMPVSGEEVVNIARNARSDVSVVFLSGSPPKEPLPDGAMFVDKANLEALRTTVVTCMARWQIHV